MKKILFPLLVALLVISCEDPFPQDLTSKQIINLSARQSDWKEYSDNGSGLNRYYSCSFSMKEINSTIFNDGAVIAYIEIDNKQQILPYVRHFEDSKGHIWTRTVDYDYSKGYITFYVTNSDFAIDPPEAMNFKVIMMW